MQLKRPPLRVAIITSNFWPEQTGIGQVTTEFAQFLSSQGVDVRVATAMPYYPEWRIYGSHRGALYQRESLDNIRIYRAWHYSRPKPSALRRILHETTLCGFSIPNMIRALRGADVAYIVSPDLSHAFVAMLIARAMNIGRVLNVQDVMPEAAVELGMLTNKTLIEIANYMAASLYKGADAIYTLGEGMQNRIARFTASSDKIQIVSNAIDAQELAPRSGQGKPFQDKFVPKGVFAVVHAGNMGEKQDLGLLLRTARLLISHADIHFYVFGDGAVKDQFLRQCESWRLTNVSLYPFQAREMVPHMLYGAGAVLVSQRKEVVDIVVPSKLITAMAAGAMIVAPCSEESETAKLLARSGGGLLTPAGDESALMGALLRIKAGVVDAPLHRERVRKFAATNFDRQVVYPEVMRSLSKLAHKPQSATRL